MGDFAFSRTRTRTRSITLRHATMQSSVRGTAADLQQTRDGLRCESTADSRHIRGRVTAYPQQSHGVAGMHPRHLRPPHDIDVHQKVKHVAWFAPTHAARAGGCTADVARLRRGADTAAPRIQRRSSADPAPIQSRNRYSTIAPSGSRHLSQPLPAASPLPLVPLEAAPRRLPSIVDPTSPAAGRDITAAATPAAKLPTCVARNVARIKKLPNKEERVHRSVRLVARSAFGKRGAAGRLERMS